MFSFEPSAFFRNAADRVDAALMTCDARQMLPLGPAAVAVHDDGDMPWSTLRRDL
jgi:hypothetical protein